jgi:hypothetical protein
MPPWLLGIICRTKPGFRDICTGSIVGTRDRSGPFDRAAMQVRIYAYCQKRPLEIIANAALAFYKDIGGPTPTGGDRLK